MRRQRGVVFHCKADRGFGWIKRPDGPDVFIHISSVEDGGCDALTDGEEVEYDLTASIRGPRAANVRRLGYKLPAPSPYSSERIT